MKTAAWMFRIRGEARSIGASSRRVIVWQEHPGQSVLGAGLIHQIPQYLSTAIARPGKVARS